MSNKNQTFVADHHELRHHSNLNDQRSAEITQAAIPPVDHLNSLVDELGVAGAIGVQALIDYHANYRQTELSNIAAAHGAIRDTLRDQVIPTVISADQNFGHRIDPAGDIQSVSL
ncbi:hypothetical protein [Nocardia sp.]|uniref:hypothetical protein n=1 Tax=Nocardia sp. TaxID=1821 RepID=UPI00262CC58A|nr:hypothetical protein [Nocardia sp.]